MSDPHDPTEPYADDGYDGPPAQPPAARVRTVMAVAALLFLGLAVWGVTWVKGTWGGGGSEPTAAATTTTAPAATATRTAAPTPSVQTATPVVPTATTPAATSTRPAVALPGGARVCDGTSQVRAASGTPRTSCAFALAVRDAWVASGGAGSVRAHSAVTGQDYTMTCAGSPLTTCRGGNRAVVYLY